MSGAIGDSQLGVAVVATAPFKLVELNFLTKSLLFFSLQTNLTQLVKRRFAKNTADTVL